MTISLYPPIGSSSSSTINTTASFSGATVDAFGRLRVSQPYTLFDSENRFSPSVKIDTSTANGGSTTYLPNESTVRMNVTTTSGSEVVRQTFRRFAYQPGKSLLTLQTFTMNASKAGLRQRAGYFGTQNGLFFQQDEAGILSFTIRSYTSGTVDDTRKIAQSAWNGDKLNGSGASGITLDVTKTQILWFDIEWLGVGNVRCGFVINGVFIICHTFYNANVNTAVYMTTAQLPLRWEITNTAGTASASNMKQICCSVMSEGGYEQVAIESAARMTNLTAASYLSTTFKPLISIRLASTSLEAVVLPSNINFLPSTADNFEIGVIKNGTLSTTPAWTAVSTDPNVEYDIGSTSCTGGILIYSEWATGKSGRTVLSTGSGYIWDLQLGASIAGVSDVLTIVARTVTTGGAATGGGIASIVFYDLTQ